MIPGTTPAAKYQVSTVPDDVTFLVRPQTEFEALMADITQERVYVVKLNLYNQVLDQSLMVYISSHPYVMDDELPDGVYIVDGLGKFLNDGAGKYIVDGT